jgi:phosphoribosyl 1,2-cyclic phosphodiesterase
VLIDAGLPGRQIEQRLVARGLDAGSVAAVVVTHEHRDHISGVGVWGRRYGVPVYMTPACRRGAEQVLGPRGLRGVAVREFEPGRGFPVGDLEFLPVATSHDAAESVGFRVTDGCAALGFATDLGCVSPELRDALRGAHLLYLESNHDEDRLWNGPYPWFLKQRIGSDRGHLSNGACATLAAELLHGGLKTLVLGHLSEINNEPHLAFRHARSLLDEHQAADDVMLLVARQDRPGRVVEWVA